MTDRELMQQALEALEADEHDMVLDKAGHSFFRKDVAITALIERLAQPEHGPVAHLWQHCETGRTRIVMPDQIITADANWFVVGPLYLTPPRREWVGVDVERNACAELMEGMGRHQEAIAIRARGAQ